MTDAKAAVARLREALERASEGLQFRKDANAKLGAICYGLLPGVLDELERSTIDEKDIARAKTLVPDFPWSEKPTAAQVMWSLSETIKGVEQANVDVHREWEKAKERLSELEAENARLREDNTALKLSLHAARRLWG